MVLIAIMYRVTWNYCLFRHWYCCYWLQKIVFYDWLPIWLDTSISRDEFKKKYAYRKNTTGWLPPCFYSNQLPNCRVLCFIMILFVFLYFFSMQYLCEDYELCMPNVEINFYSVLFWYLFDVSYLLKLPDTMLIHATSFVGEAYEIMTKLKS